MGKHLKANAVLLALTLLVGAVAYPLMILVIGQGLFPSSANGSLVKDSEGKVVGSRLIAQEFKGDEWFQPRPSAVGYTANASGGSNLGANNPKLRERVEEQLKGLPKGTTVPADAVTTSGSGLDPHITLENALGQVERVAAALAAKLGRDVGGVREALKTLVGEMAFAPLGGLVGGGKIVGVLELNLEVAKRLK